MHLRQFAKNIYFRCLVALAMLLFWPRVMLFWLSRRPKNKLHIGCGKNYLAGWVNADITPFAELIIFLQWRIPFRDESLSLVFSEHVLEHVSLHVAKKHLRELHRVLKPGGIVRIAMPDLDDIISCYLDDWKRADWVNWPEYSYVQSRVQAINMAFREWGHQYLYNREEIVRLLAEAGFSKINFALPGVSHLPGLCGLETRPDSKLIVEAEKG